MINNITTKSAMETENIGKEFAGKLKIGDIVVLNGNLGAGKTTFVQGIAKGLSVKSRVISPTFVLVRKHKGKMGEKKINLYHMDLYRLNTHDMASLGLEDIFEDVNGIFIFEWGEKNELIKSDWEIKFVIDEGSRRIIINKNE